MSEISVLDPIKQIPTPPVIRKRLSLVVREADFLRRLLRLSENLATSGLRDGASQERESVPCA